MYDKRMIIRMGLDPRVLKQLIRIHKLFRKDKNYSIRKGIQAGKFILQNERIVKHEKDYVLSTFLPAFGSEAFFTNLKAVKVQEEPFKCQILSKRSAPISTYLEITKACNLSCEHCSSHYGHNKSELSVSEWIDVVKQLQDMNVSDIGITGGEPLLKKGFIDILKAIDDRSRVILFTNGYYLTRELAKELKDNGLFAIGISLDSHIEEIHNKRRKDSEAFKKALEAIEIAKEAGLYTMVQTVILKNQVNEKEVLSLFELCASLNVDEIKILEPIRSGRFLGKDETDIFYDQVSRDKLINIQHKANKSRKYPKITTFAYTESKQKFGCGAGVQHSYINAFGDIVPCDFVPMKFGNVRDGDIHSQWLEMNEILDGPKIGCFANIVNNDIAKLESKEYPLNKKQSCEICKNKPKNGITDFEKIVL